MLSVSAKSPKLESTFRELTAKAEVTPNEMMAEWVGCN
jgi:hypothetical protein